MTMRNVLLCFVVLALAAAGLQAQVAVVINPATIPNGLVVVPYSVTLSATGGLAPYTWAIVSGALPPGLSFSGGVISGTPTTVGTYSFMVRAIDSTAATTPLVGFRSYTMSVSIGPVSIVTSTLPAATQGLSYSTSLAASGGSGVYTWSLVSGSLPAGMGLSSGGVLGGMPSASGAFTFTVQVSSPNGQGGQFTATRSLTLLVDPPPLTITTPQLPSATVGVTYSQALQAVGASGSYSWSVLVGSLPPGILLSGGGLLAGTPTTVGDYTFTVQVASSLSSGAPVTANRNFTLSVLPATLAITTTQLPNGTVGVSYAQTLAATGGVFPHSWRVSQGRLPDGLSMTAGGMISGSPTTAGTFQFTVTVSDAREAADSRGFSITITPAALTITTERVPDATEGVQYSVALAAVGGVPPYTWSLSSGSLPGGLTLASSGAISGTPNVPGTFTFTVQVADSRQTTATRTYTTTIRGRLRITTTSPLAPATAGIFYAQQFAASGGTPPYTWTIASGALPGGTSLTTTNGFVTGTPELPGAYTFVIVVTDSARDSDRQSFTINVAAQLAITTSSPLPGAVAGVAYSQRLDATGGTPPYQWSVSAGSLPAGLTLDSSSGVVSGTPTSTGSSEFTVQVADSQSRRATRGFSLSITQGLAITTASLPGGTLGSPYSQQLAAAGGTQPYTWSIAAGALPGGIALNSATGQLSGSPTAAGAFRFTAAVADARQAAARRDLSIDIAIPSLPPPQITGLPATPSPASQPSLGVSLGGPYPVEVTGRLTLTFAPESGPDDPAIQFTTGGRTADYRIPAGSTQAVFGSPSVGVQTGTVAGTITVTTRLQAGGSDVTPTPVPTQIMRISRAAPVISSASLARTATGFDLVVNGYATSREVTSALVRYVAASGVTLSSNEATIQLGSAFTTWYQSSDSARFGSQFSLRIPFTVQGSTNPITSMSVTLTNSVGTSAAANAAF